MPDDLTRLLSGQPNPPLPEGFRERLLARLLGVETATGRRACLRATLSADRPAGLCGIGYPLTARTTSTDAAKNSTIGPRPTSPPRKAVATVALVGVGYTFPLATGGETP